jgi:hypothetical protein
VIPAGRGSGSRRRGYDGTMNKDRRGFLKLFGLSTAAVAAVPAIGADPTIEVVTADTPAITPNPFVPGRAPVFQGLEYCVRDEPLWSMVKIEPNSMRVRYQLFQQPGETMAESNMRMGGMLPMPEMYSIRQIGFVFSPQTIPALRSAFIDRYALALWLGRKTYWEAPLSTVFSVGEPDRDKNGFATLPDAGFATLDIPLVIEQSLFFCLELIGKPIHPCGKLKGWGVFRGLHAVGIQ